MIPAGTARLPLSFQGTRSDVGTADFPNTTSTPAGVAEIVTNSDQMSLSINPDFGLETEDDRSHRGPVKGNLKCSQWNHSGPL